MGRDLEAVNSISLMLQSVFLRLSKCISQTLVNGKGCEDCGRHLMGWGGREGGCSQADTKCSSLLRALPPAHQLDSKVKNFSG